MRSLIQSLVQFLASNPPIFLFLGLLLVFIFIRLSKSSTFFVYYVGTYVVCSSLMLAVFDKPLVGVLTIFFGLLGFATIILLENRDMQWWSWLVLSIYAFLFISISSRLLGGLFVDVSITKFFSSRLFEAFFLQVGVSKTLFIVFCIVFSYMAFFHIVSYILASALDDEQSTLVKKFKSIWIYFKSKMF